MAAVYPGQIRTFTNPLSTDYQDTTSHSSQHTLANDEVNAIETTLGTTVQGTFTDLMTRMGSITGSLNAIPTNIPGTTAYFLNAANFTSIQAALNQANTNGGGVVFLPAGTYNIGTQMEIYNNTTLMGVGPDSVVRATASMVGMLHGTAIGTISIHDIRWNGNSTAKNGIWIENLLNFQISHNVFHDIGTTTADSIACIDLWGHYGIISDNICRDTIGTCRGIFVTSGSTFEVTIANNVCSNTWEGLSMDDGAYHVIMSGNNVSDSRETGIFVSTIGSVVISNNTVNWATPSASSLGITVAGNATTQNKDIVISGNNLNLNRSGGGANGGIDLHYLTNVTVTGNIVKNGSVGGGIYADNCMDLVITGNRCYDDLGTKAQAYGLSLQGSTDYCTIIGNNFRGNRTASWTLGTGTNNIGTGAGYNIT